MPLVLYPWVQQVAVTTVARSRSGRQPEVKSEKYSSKVGVLF